MAVYRILRLWRFALATTVRATTALAAKETTVTQTAESNDATEKYKCPAPARCE
jgi:hypothetical protein